MHFSKYRLILVKDHAYLQSVPNKLVNVLVGAHERLVEMGQRDIRPPVHPRNPPRPSAKQFVTASIAASTVTIAVFNFIIRVVSRLIIAISFHRLAPTSVS
jgi:hypothetical protein